jgi:hypothetical protein
MLRAAAWTCGLFAVGAGVLHWMPAGGTWIEPVVLAALGIGLIVAGGRRGASTGDAAERLSSRVTTAERAAR